MAASDSLTLLELLRTRPVQSGLLVVVPLAVAGVQLLNSYVNDLSLFVSVPFSVGLLAFSALALDHHLAQLRLRRLEEETTAHTAE